MGATINILSDLENESSKVFKYTVGSHSDLLLLTDVEEGNIAWVENTTGIPYINRKLKGVWQFKGGTWEYGNQDIQSEIITNVSNISSLNFGLTNVQSDLNEIEKIYYIVADFQLPDSATVTRNFTVVNDTNIKLNLFTILADKIEGEDNIIIYPCESFTINKKNVNNYKVI